MGITVMLRPGYGHVPIRLLVAAFLLYGIQAKCGTLKVSDMGALIDTDSVCARLYHSEECSRFASTFDSNDLPPGFPRTTGSVSRPEALAVSVIDNDKGSKVLPGISVKWQSPGSDEARYNCLGYLLTWHSERSKKACSLFLLNTSDSDVAKPLGFQYDIQAVEEMSLYIIEVFTMPSSSDPQYRQVATSSIQTPPAFAMGDVGINPSEWTPRILHQTFANGTIIVKFTLAPAKFKITRYAVMLSHKDDLPHPLYDVDYRPGLFSLTNTHGLQVFQVNQSGCYHIVVQVVEEDENHMVEGKCRCWTQIEEEVVCESCGSTFIISCLNITGPSTETATSAASNETAISLDNRTETISSHLTEGILGGLIVAILIVMLVFFIAFCVKHHPSVIRCYKKESSWNPPKAQNINNNLCQSDPGKYSDLSVVVPLTRKTVYIIYANDHQPHSQLVESLVAFLNIHCHCRVLTPMHCDCDKSEMYQWFIDKISTADYILFLDSKGAEHLIVAYLNNRSYRANRTSVETDLFHQGVKYLMKNNDVRDNHLMIVSFEGRHCQKYLQVSTVYTLPDNLAGLLQKLHSLSERNAKAYDDWLPLHIENIPNLPEGARLLSAVQAVKDFEKCHPDWLEKRFGVQTLLSEDAGYSSDVMSSCGFVSHQDQTSSGFVSPQDQTSSGFDSPGSVFEEPDFFSCLHAADSHHHTKALEVAAILGHVDSGRCYSQKQPDKANVYIISNNRDSGDVSNPSPWHQLENIQPKDLNYAVGLETRPLDGESIIPPETMSEFICDNYSTALAQFIPPETMSEFICDSYSRALAEIIPPETMSEFICDSYSTALAEINANGESILEYLQSQTSHDANGNSINTGSESMESNLLVDLKPPETLSNIQENLSSCFRDINANTEKCHDML